MARRLSVEEWAKIRYDREIKGLSFTDLAKKYNLSRGSIHKKSVAEQWDIPKFTKDEVQRRIDTVNDIVKPTSRRRPKAQSEQQDQQSEQQDQQSEQQKANNDNKKPIKKEEDSKQSEQQDQQSEQSKANDESEQSKANDESEQQNLNKNNKKPIKKEKDSKQSEQKNSQSEQSKANNESEQSKRTQKRTDEKEKPDFIQDYIDKLNKGLPPSRAHAPARAHENEKKSSEFQEHEPINFEQTIEFSASEFTVTADSYHELSYALSDLKSITEGKYNPKFAPIARNIALLGGTTALLADSLGVVENTILRWLEKHRDFYVAWQSGKTHADGKVAHSVYIRALGYNAEVSDVKIVDGLPMEIKKIIHVPPEPRSQEYWLNNRQPELWQSVVDYTPPPAPPLLDEDEMDQMYEEVLNEAEQESRRIIEDRKANLNLTLDGDIE